jgi:hypothetical protein
VVLLCETSFSLCTKQGVLPTSTQAVRYTKGLEAHQSQRQEPTTTGVEPALGKDHTHFELFEDKPESSKRFKLAMSPTGRPIGQFSSAVIVDEFEWSKFGDITIQM